MSSGWSRVPSPCGCVQQISVGPGLHILLNEPLVATVSTIKTVRLRTKKVNSFIQIHISYLKEDVALGYILTSQMDFWVRLLPGLPPEECCHWEILKLIWNRASWVLPANLCFMQLFNSTGRMNMEKRKEEFYSLLSAGHSWFSHNFQASHVILFWPVRFMPFELWMYLLFFVCLFYLA